MAKVPHLVQYQGSKRSIAPEIIKYFPKKVNRLIEPFAGTCAVSILAATEDRCMNDINEPLVRMMKKCVNSPSALAEEYEKIWKGQFSDGQNNVDYFYKVRDEFNNGIKDSAHMLFLLARVVKGAVRYNAQGIMNQSCDNRRNGTKPDIVRRNANRISELLKGKAEFYALDYKKVLEMAQPGDLIYMDPPYQGTSTQCNPRDNRYIQGVDFDEFVEELRKLNYRGIDYIVSYDGMTGDKMIGKMLPNSLNLTHLYIDAGVSAQATLNGKKEITYESLYLSCNIQEIEGGFEQIVLNLA